MNLRPFLFSGVLLLSTAACGGETVDPTPPGSSPSAGSATANQPESPGEDDSLPCGNIVASNYDASCNVDADCVAVPIGGNTCFPCSAGSGDFACLLTVLNTTSSATYTTALQMSLAQWQGTDEERCIIQSCPYDVGPAPRCVAHTCMLP